MKNGTALLSVVGTLTIAIFAAYKLSSSAREDPAAQAESNEASMSGPKAPDPAIAPAGDRGDAPQAQTSEDTSLPESAPEPASTDSQQVFRTDNRGALLLDQQTRLRMETLFALTDPAELEAGKHRAMEELPASAAAQAADLLEDYDNYQQAQRQTYPPGSVPPTVEAAIAELEGLHALREAYFGNTVAEAFYGVEERIARSLIELMRLEKDQSLTMAEKVERAQRLRDQMPNIKALEQRNRQQAQEQE